MTNTTGGNANGARCAIPFMYNGKRHKHCILNHTNASGPQPGSVADIVHIYN